MYFPVQLGVLLEMAPRVKLAYSQCAGYLEVPGSCCSIFIYSLGLWPEIWVS